MRYFSIYIRTGVLLAIPIFFYSCQKSIEKPEPQTVELGGGSGATSSFIIVSDHITTTDKGVAFNGALSTKTSEGETFLLGEGEFDLVTDPGGAVVSIVGAGLAQFPKVGLFAEILKTFAWKFIKAHIEYETGAYFIEKYNTQIPLNPERRYLHYKVFDDTKDGDFELRNIANQVFYSFNDMYIDPLDPAIFMKVRVKMPGTPKTPADGNIVAGFWQKTQASLVSFGGSAVSYAGGMEIIIGMSNQALFNSKSYAFKVANLDAFRERYGFDSFESVPSHLFTRVSGVPIPHTGILRIWGESYMHYPLKTLVPEIDPTISVKDNYSAALNWLNNEEEEAFTLTASGGIDMGGKGIGAIVAQLPNVNEKLGKEVFGEDFDVDLVPGTFQYQIPGLSKQHPGFRFPSFMRFGLELKKPVLADLFGESIKQHIYFYGGASRYFFFSLGPTTDEISFYTEVHSGLEMSEFGHIDLANTYFYVGKKGIELGSEKNIQLGPLEIESGLEGRLGPDGFFLQGTIDKTFTLPGNAGVNARRLKVTVDSKVGIVEMEGSVELPLGIGEAAFSGRVTREGITMEGNLDVGTNLNLGDGLQLPSTNMRFSYSSLNNKGLELEFDTDVPFVGSVRVKGSFKDGEVLLEGQPQTRQITFGNATLPHTDGKIIISTANGIRFSGLFDLAPFGNRILEGPITRSDIQLSGSFAGTVPIGGHDFTFAGGAITANNSGVRISGLIDLYRFKVQVAGDYIAPDNFTLKGTHNYDGQFLKTGILVTVTPSSVSLTGTGQVYGVLGNELYSGALRFVPNWANKTIRTCYTLLGSEHCVSL